LKHLVKPFLYFVTILLTIVLAVVVFQSNRALLSEADAKKIVAERYAGDIKDFHMTANKQYFKVIVEDKRKRFQFKIDRYNEKISNLKVLKHFENKDKQDETRRETKKENKIEKEQKKNLDETKNKKQDSKNNPQKELKESQSKPQVKQPTIEQPASNQPAQNQHTSQQPVYTQEVPSHQQQSNVQVQESPYYYYSDDDDDDEYDYDD